MDFAARARRKVKPYSLVIDDRGMMWGERGGKPITRKTRNIWRLMDEAERADG